MLLKHFADMYIFGHGFYLVKLVILLIQCIENSILSSGSGFLLILKKTAEDVKVGGLAIEC